LTDVQVEHLLGLGTGLPLVKLRCISNQAVLYGQLAPEQAREIASHLLEAAARSEYELDLVTGATAQGIDHDKAVALLLLVRAGEALRHGDTSA
jgi:hypothetical protein